MLDSVLEHASLNKSDLTHIAYANGPGAFTGVRIAASTAQGLSIGLNIPLLPVSTLAVVAQQAADIHQVDKIIATLDARMGEAYVATYHLNTDTQLVKLEGDELLIKLENLQQIDHYFSAGSGFKAKRESGLNVDQDNLDEDILPHASALAKLARHIIDSEINSHDELPLVNYIRNNVAVKKKQATL